VCMLMCMCSSVCVFGRRFLGHMQQQFDFVRLVGSGTYGEVSLLAINPTLCMYTHIFM